MEVGIDPTVPTYAGGLCILAGDTLRAAADLGIPMVGVTLLARKGYFCQTLDSEGNQKECPAEWRPEDRLELMPARASVTVEGRQVWIQAWRYIIRGISQREVRVYFLDTALPENSPEDQGITDHLYGGDERYRLRQEVILGMGGIALLRALGYSDVEAYHMNEGHSALLALALLAERPGGAGAIGARKEDVELVREQCVFTTHTPVPAGMDKFPLDLVRPVLGDQTTDLLTSVNCLTDNSLNMTYLALFFSRYVNGVSMRHEEISHGMFPHYPMNSVTNGVHAVTWTCPPFASLYDRRIPEWRKDNLYLRYAISIPHGEIRQTHIAAKTALLDEVKRRGGAALDPTVFTIGYARRMTSYKRANLLFTDIERLKRIAKNAGALQIVYGGKAHPRDDGGKDMIRSVFAAGSALKDTIPVVFLEEYDMTLAKFLCSGVDLWLNTPQKPQEASGTSGMKAALNGVPSFSTMDGWWVEGHVESVTGWAIGGTSQESNPEEEINSLYDKLENLIVPMFYKHPDTYDAVMRYAIALNGSYYNTQRMVFQYLDHAYMPYH